MHHRPTVRTHSDGQPVRSAIENVTKLRVGGAERHVSRARPMCVAAVVNVYVTATWGCGNGPPGPQRSGTAQACTVALTVAIGSMVIEQSCSEAPRGWSTTLQTSRAPPREDRKGQCSSPNERWRAALSTRVKEYHSKQRPPYSAITASSQRTCPRRSK